MEPITNNTDPKEEKIIKKSRLTKRLVIFLLLTIATIISIKAANNLAKEGVPVISEIYKIEAKFADYENFKTSEKYLTDLEKEDVKDWFNIK